MIVCWFVTSLHEYPVLMSHYIFYCICCWTWFLWDIAHLFFLLDLRNVCPWCLSFVCLVSKHYNKNWFHLPKWGCHIVRQELVSNLGTLYRWVAASSDVSQSSCSAGRWHQRLGNSAFDSLLVTVDWTPFTKGPWVQLSHSNTPDIWPGCVWGYTHTHTKLTLQYKQKHIWWNTQ